LSPAALDALVAAADAAWTTDAARLGVPPLPLLPGIIAQLAFGPGDGRMRYVIRTHVVPRQRALLDAFEREPVHPSRVGALNAMVYHAVTLPLGFDPDAPEAAQASALSARVLALAERYCAADFGVRGGAFPCRLRDDAREAAALWELVAASTAGDAQTATDGFVRLVGRGIETADDPGLVRDLALRHAARAGGEDRLRVLDALLTGTTDRFTDLDSLRADFAEADPVGGIARFERGLAARPAFRLDVMADAPALRGQMPDVLSGAPFSLDALAGRLVLVDVWATWCAPCLNEIPALNGLHASVAGRDDVALVSVLADARTGGLLPPDAEAFVAARGVAYPVLYDLAGEDEALGAALNVTGYPSRFLVYPDGSVRFIPHDVSWRTALALATTELGLAPVGG
ncbi:MAG TPA: TlpA disulfide reductase family protein, partial [Rubricoccaceae bacterium]